MAVRGETELPCLSGLFRLSGAQGISDPDNSPLNIHNSQLAEARLVATADRR